jgi:MFS family permease
MLFSIVPMLLAMPFQSLLAVFAEDVWDTGALGLGILNAAAGLGGLLGAVYVAFFGESDRKLALMMSSITLFGCCLFAFAVSPWFIVGVAFVLFADIFAGIFQTINNSVVQVLIPDEVRGRVMSLMMMSFGLTPLGTVPISIVAEFLGAPFAIAAASVLLVLGGGLFYLFSRTLRDIDRFNRAALESERTSDGRAYPVAAAGA